MMDGLYLPPKPAIIIPKPSRIIRPGGLRLKVDPPFLAGLLINPYGLAPAGTWQTVMSNTLGSDTSGWQNITCVQFIPQASLTVTGGSLVRVTLKGPAANAGVITGLYIGQASASYSNTSPAFASTPVQLLVSGSGTITLTTGGTFVTDDASLSIPTSNGLVISWQFNATSANMPFTGSFLPTNWRTSYKTAADAATVAKSGYTDYTAVGANIGNWLVNKVEVFA